MGPSPYPHFKAVLPVQVPSPGALQDSNGNIVAALVTEGILVLTCGEGNLLAADEEGNTSAEAADSSGAVLGSNGNIFTAGDAECNVVLTDGEGIAVLVTEDGSAVTILPEGTRR